MAKNRLPVIALVFCALYAVLCGCIRPALPPPTTLKINQIETGPLRGKTIVIDPGHGGPEHGALGPHGLQETEVNLGVALYLWGMLKYAGVNALLTRSADTSVDNTLPFSLEKDLDARAALANQNNADLFISIHHNSDTRHRNRNDIQIYYKMSDTGPSRDVAKSILQSLKKKLNAAGGNIYPGNYRVLRTAGAAAILGESSFISNNKNEGRLSYQRTLQAEAEGYFEGILSYYQRGVPVIADLYPNKITLSIPRPEIRCRILSGTGSNQIDASSIILKLDGNSFNSFSLNNANILTFLPSDPLSNSQHKLCITAKNRDGNRSPEACALFTISLPPARIAMTPVFTVIPPDGVSSTAIDISVSDYMERPVIDGTAVTLTATGGRLPEPIVHTRGGHARAILFSELKANTVTVKAAAGTIFNKTSITFAAPDEALLVLTIRDTAGNSLSGAEVHLNDKKVSISDERGMTFFRNACSASAEFSIIKKGFLPVILKTVLRTGCMARENIILNQVDGGILFKKKLILDPAGTTKQSLLVITELKKKIEDAGGEVHLTWSDAPAPSVKDRIMLATRMDADLFLSVEITGEELSAGYYHKSILGKALAENTCQEFDNSKEKKSTKCTPFVSNDFMIVQTTMPAVLIRLPKSSLNNISAVVSNIYQALLNALNKRQ
jgi:N-acetylmuramoyl-L-alanine amidase